MENNSNNNKITPIEKLKQDKLRLKNAYSKDAERIQQNWNYITDNFSSLFIQTAFNSAKGLIGGGDKTNTAEDNNPLSFLSSFTKMPSLSFLNIFSSAIPVVWKIAQPMILGLAVKKIKNMLFGSKKSKK